MADDPCVLIKRCNSDLSCCGIVLDSVNGIVLTVASLFLDALPQIESRCKISQDSPFLVKNDFAAASPKGKIAVEVIFRRNGEEEFKTLQGHVALYWRDYGLQRVAERIFPQSEWKFESLAQGEKTTFQAEKKNGDESLTHQNCLSDFVLIQLKTLNDYFSSKPVNLSAIRGFGTPKKGDTVFLVGTPFGCECPPVFYNSISKGIVSNVVGSNSEIIITDARCVPGCEGCPLYLKRFPSGLTKNSAAPTGIVLAPFCWKNGEWTGVTVASSLVYILHNLWMLVREKNSLMPQQLNSVILSVLNCQDKTQNPVDLILKGNHDRNTFMHSDQDSLRARNITKRAISSVVMVQCGYTWGSGIVVDAEACLIATCSHVIRGCSDALIVTADKTLNQYLNSTTEVRVAQICWSNTHHKAQVLYATKESCPLDFALLRMEPNPKLTSLKPRLKADVGKMKPLYNKGEEISVVGFPLFASNLNIGASVVSGVLSNVVHSDCQPVLLQSTAAVHSGASGGALVSMETGELLGMVTSHTKDADLSSTFPHVNFSIPADLLYKLVSAVENGNVEEILQGLISDCVKSVWQLKKIDKPQITSKL